MTNHSGPNKNQFSYISKAIVIIITILLLIYVFQGVSWDELLSTLLNLRPEYVILVGLLTCLNTLIRGLRWWLLLIADQPVAFKNVLCATAVGQMVNNVIPARGGDVFRAVFLNRFSQVSNTYGISTTLVERVFDAFFLTITALVMAQMIRVVPPWIQSGIQWMIILCTLGFVILLLIPFLGKRIFQLTRFLPLSSDKKHKLEDLLARFSEGLRVLYNLRRITLFLVITMLIWTLDALSMMLWASAFDLHLLLTESFFLNALLGISQAIPTTPGGLGVYQGIAIAVLVPLGFTKSQSLAFILSAQIYFYFIVSIQGALGLLFMKGNVAQNPKNY